MATVTSDILSQRQPPRHLRMTEEDFVNWQKKLEFGKAEWVDGEVTLMMAPVSGEHDNLQTWLISIARTFVDERKLGKIKGPQFVARMTIPGDRPQISRREPDLLFIDKSHLHLLKPNHFEGAPDLVMEIVSPESQSRDWREKYLEYEAAGAREYWIIDPLGKNVEAYALQSDHKYRQLEEVDGRLHSTVISGWYLKPDWLWQPELPRALQILAELGIK